MKLTTTTDALQQLCCNPGEQQPLYCKACPIGQARSMQDRNLSCKDWAIAHPDKVREILEKEDCYEQISSEEKKEMDKRRVEYFFVGAFLH